MPTGSGGVVPLSQVARVEQLTGPIQINRERNQRRWIVQGNVRGRDLGGVVTDIQERIAAKVDLPPGYTVEYGGQFENQQRAMKRLSIIVPTVIGLVLVMLWMSFGVMRHALIIVVNVPLALIGGILGLLITRSYLSVPASVGFIALFGIAVQNGMVLVTYFNDLRERGKSVAEAVTEGAELRLRPEQGRPVDRQRHLTLGKEPTEEPTVDAPERGVGARPLNREDQQKLFLHDDRVWKVSDNPFDKRYRYPAALRRFAPRQRLR